MMKNACYFMLKTLFALKIFALIFFCPIEKRLDKKAKVNFKSYDVTNRKMNIAINKILPNISRSKGNQAKT